MMMMLFFGSEALAVRVTCVLKISAALLNHSHFPSRHCVLMWDFKFFLKKCVIERGRRDWEKDASTPRGAFFGALTPPRCWQLNYKWIHFAWWLPFKEWSSRTPNVDEHYKTIAEQRTGPGMVPRRQAALPRVRRGGKNGCALPQVYRVQHHTGTGSPPCYYFLPCTTSLRNATGCSRRSSTASQIDQVFVDP